MLAEEVAEAAERGLKDSVLLCGDLCDLLLHPARVVPHRRLDDVEYPAQLRAVFGVDALEFGAVLSVDALELGPMLGLLALVFRVVLGLEVVEDGVQRFEQSGHLFGRVAPGAREHLDVLTNGLGRGRRT
ncbi:hypothetical protein [Nannocystis pusilla]|uniref:Uncharacterized protein n=1 Tax=Nannocystis pusilla TaxID=889268 RepID=A0ABS7TM32_9BACT|nr:hypothetical protein [Nannocystis pusilla]MBZ5709275.1 hypothetical protein [Nannocystis pusilla]